MSRTNASMHPRQPISGAAARRIEQRLAKHKIIMDMMVAQGMDRNEASAIAYDAVAGTGVKATIDDTPSCGSENDYRNAKPTPRTEDEAAEQMDNGRNTGGRAYSASFIGPVGRHHKE